MSDVEHRPEASDDRAADDRGERRWHRRRHPHQRPFVDQHAVGERPDVRHRADRAPVGGEEPRPLAAGPPRRVRVRAHERLTLLATCARAAADDEAGDDMVADGDRLDSGADRFDHADRLVAEQHRPRPGEHPVEVVEVAVAQARRQCAHRDLARPRRVDVDLGDDEEVGSVIEHCSHGHASDRTRGVTGPAQAALHTQTHRILRCHIGTDSISIRCRRGSRKMGRWAGGSRGEGGWRRRCSANGSSARAHRRVDNIRPHAGSLGELPWLRSFPSTSSSTGTRAGHPS